ncbi:DUF6094 domain-containing protein [Methylocaldum sp. 14B]|jgi:hypothetical protein|uniref:DUF6094 domain-containing protein n=1 Tax=Methylocaldum sp. 14B TaxID=1912213 RepID=UPI00098B69FF|nr:DUF6094 domain-containing protein [Methylocaldum sp. 14B]
MALMFQRLARNFVKAGYFPTDEDTLARVLSMLEPSAQGSMRIIDPCAGEGVALAECRQHLGPGRTEAFGVEFDAERAWHAKGLLDRVIHGDYQETVITPKSFGLLWLNPPYGDLVGDKGATGDATKGRQRLEKLFYQRAVRLFQPGGVMVLIVPHTSLDKEFSGWIAAHFEQVAAFRAPVQTYRQAVVVGVRRRGPQIDDDIRPVRDHLARLHRGETEEVLPDIWPGEPYVVPPVPGNAVPLRFNAVKMDPAQLKDEIRRFPCLWPQFDLHLARTAKSSRRPLKALSRWHLALSLAAGQVSGVVKSSDGARIYVIKGDTFKRKDVTTAIEETESGRLVEIRTATDVFVPVIRALDFTPDSPTFGRALVIQ